jgi:hypothetical protein
VIPADDPVRAQRARVARWVSFGLRLGGLLFAVAMAGFFAGLATGFPPWLASLVVACLFAGSALLAPAIVFGYGVRAAERADREGTWR